ncbi:MAG: hypothetical protein HC831_23055 [Chloroflexia bacterium]|nr:hypothetical protein [Chloroflexia bacterium]
MAHVNSFSCDNWHPSALNAKIIKIPDNVESVCASSPIPDGYVVTGYGNSMSCNNWHPSAKTQSLLERLKVQPTNH